MNKGSRSLGHVLRKRPARTLADSAALRHQPHPEDGHFGVLLVCYPLLSVATACYVLLTLFYLACTRFLLARGTTFR